jgi:hypothetical protein
MPLTNPSLRQASQLVYDYPSAKKFLNYASSRKLAHNTTVLDRSRDVSTIRHGNAIAVRYHNTDIVTYFEDGTIIVNNGGYMTVTTNKRLNLFLPPGFRVMQKNWQMYLLAPHDRKLPFSTYVEFNADNLRQAGEVVQLEHNRELVPKHIGEGRDLWTPRKQNPPRGPGKFDSDLDAALYALSMDGTDGDYGDVDSYGHHVDLMLSITLPELRRGAKDAGESWEDVSKDVLDYGLKVPFSAILDTDSNGFVSVELFQDANDARIVFENGESDYEDFLFSQGGSED